MLIIVDTEASGPCPMFGDVISIGAVVAEPGFTRTFRSPNMRPMFDKYSQSAYDSIGMTREEHLSAPASYEEGFTLFGEWIDGLSVNRPTCTSDNPAFDWQWVNFGFHLVLGRNPFGHSARRIGDMHSGLVGNIRDHSSWKRLRVTKHTHDPVDDAMGNAEALLKMWERAAK